jgi:hypothetical protein
MLLLCFAGAAFYRRCVAGGGALYRISSLATPQDIIKLAIGLNKRETSPIEYFARNPVGTVSPFPIKFFSVSLPTSRTA